MIGRGRSLMFAVLDRITSVFSMHEAPACEGCIADLVKLLRKRIG
jgi:hypothetical protein